MTRLCVVAGISAWLLSAASAWADPDVNDDGFVDLLDLALFRQCFFQNINDVPSCNSADQNGDDIVNVVDLGALREFYFRHYPAPDASNRFYPSLIVPINARAFAGLADLTGDNVPDLLGASSSLGGIISIATGAGDGTFTDFTQQFIGCPNPDFDLRDGLLIDLNGDDQLDILGICRAGAENEELTVYRNLGGAIYALGDSYELIGFNNEIRLGDIDANGVTDFLVARANFFDPTNSAVIFNNNNDGTLSLSAEVALPTDVTSLAFGDANGDDFADIALVVEHDNNPNTGELFLSSGDGDGNFGAAALIDDSVGDEWLRMVDLNEDGHPDIVTCCQPSLEIVLGDAAGGLQPSVGIGGFLTGDFVAFADLNADTHLDLLMTDSNDVFFAYLFSPSAGAPDFSFGPTAAVGAGAFFQVGSKTIVKDALGNGYPDVLSPGGLGVALKPLVDGDSPILGVPAFDEPQLRYSSDFILRLNVADVNNDSFQDVIRATVSLNEVTEIRVFSGSADGLTLPGPPTFEQGRIFGIDSGDLDGDGFVDLAVTRGSNENVTLLFGDGAGLFTNPTTFISGGRDVIIADMNGDEFQDLAVSTLSDPEVAILLSDGNGTFAPAQTFAFDEAVRILKSSDLDLNGTNDLIAASSYSLDILLNSSDDGFSEPTRVAIDQLEQSSVLRDVTIANLDDDEFPDLAVALSHISDGPAYILLFQGIGDGSFELRTEYLMPGPINERSPGQIRVANVNDDSFPDLIVQDGYENAAFVYLAAEFYEYDKVQKYGPMFHQGNSFNSGAADVADLNGDGLPDIMRTASEDPSVISILYHKGLSATQ